MACRGVGRPGGASRKEPVFSSFFFTDAGRVQLLVLPSQLCQTIEERLFFLLSIKFWELSNHKICQSKFNKLLEML